MITGYGRVLHRTIGRMQQLDFNPRGRHRPPPPTLPGEGGASYARGRLAYHGRQTQG